MALHVAGTLQEAFPDRFAVPPRLRARAGPGRTGADRPHLSVGPGVAAMPAAAGRPRRSRCADVPLAEEIRLMPGQAVAAAPEDIDLCLILGAGWPFRLGWITPFPDRSGIAEKITGSRFRL